MNKEMILGIVRHVMTAAGAILVAKGIGDAETMQQVGGGVLALISVVLSALDKKKVK